MDYFDYRTEEERRQADLEAERDMAKMMEEDALFKANMLKEKTEIIPKANLEYKYKLVRVTQGTWRDARTAQEKEYWHVVLSVKSDKETPEEVLEYCREDLVDPYGDVQMHTKDDVNAILFRGKGEWSECFNVLVTALDENMWQLDLHCYHFHRYAPKALIK